jgi:cytoskeleton protein RodZ
VIRSQGAARATSRHRRSFDLLPWGLTPTVSARPSDHQPAFDPVAERLVDIGRHLREARQQRGEDLYDVADYLRIKPSYLFALEEGDLASMPGRTYAMGFLRTYADHLGYDGAEVVRQLKTTGEPEASLKVRQPVAENRLPSLGVVVLALVLAAVAYGGWFAAQSGDDVLARIKALPGEIGQYAAAMFEDEPAAPMTASIEAPDGPDEAPPEVLSATAVAPGGTTAGASASSPADPVGSAAGPIGGVQAGEVPHATAAARPAAGGVDITAVIADRRAGAGAGAAASDVEDPLAALVLDAEAERAEALRRLDEERPDGGTVGELLAALQATPGDAVGGNGEAPAVTVVSDTGRITLVAREASWIQVQSPGRDFLRSTTLQPGQRFDLPDRTDLALWTGNAGGLEVWVDGRNLGVLGASGAVMRDVPLTPEALRARL